MARQIFEGRHESLYHWAIDEKETNPIIAEVFEALEGEFEEVRLGRSPQSSVQISGFQKDFRTLPGFLRKMYQVVRAHVYYTYKGRRAGQYLLWSNLKYFFRYWQGLRRLPKRRWKRLSDISDKPFVFFPLHVEPEIAMQAKSPEFLVQLSAIISLSKNLPAGILLAVKEHRIALGRRPKDFYGQIAELKNVVLLDINLSGIDIIEKAAVVATITGTSGFEAATIGKPVITFGRHNIYSFLPHVFELTDDIQLKSYLEQSLSKDFDVASARTDGAKFLAAMKKVGFDMGQFDHALARGYSSESAKSAVDKLEASVFRPGSPTSLEEADVLRNTAAGAGD